MKQGESLITWNTAVALPNMILLQQIFQKDSSNLKVRKKEKGISTGSIQEYYKKRKGKEQEKQGMGEEHSPKKMLILSRLKS